MLHVFPEVDSKHSESEWNQDSDTCIGKYLSGEILLIRERILRFSQMNVLFFFI